MYYISYYFSEIRLRLAYLLVSFLSCFLLCYLFQYEYIYLLGKPVFPFHHHFIFLNFTEGMTTILGISAAVALGATLPFGVYQWWCFFAPSWYRWERKAWAESIFEIALLGSFEACVIFLVVIPSVCQFFLSFQFQVWDSSSLEVFRVDYLPRLSSYSTALLWFFCICLLIFQVPLFVKAGISCNLFGCWDLCQYRSFAVFACILGSALLAPPDVFMQCLLTAILYCMYELSIFLGFLGSKKSKVS